MSIDITFSSTNGGSAITEPLDHGSKGAGNNTTAQTIHIRHDGNNSISHCRVYVATKSGTYAGSKTAAEDKAELLGWGDASTDGYFGGVQFNFDAEGSFPTASWGTVSDKDPTGGSTVRTGVGDSAANGIVLPTSVGIDTAGVVPNGSSPNVRFQTRIKIPSAGTAVGIREFDIGVAFTYVS